jgi:SAM-dependent methyltransferase
MRISFDRIADRYDETRAFPVGVTERIIDALERYLSKRGRVLDVGVGTGRLAAPMSSSGFDVTGVDVSRMMLGKARAKGLDQLLVADARSLPFHDASFAYSVSVHLTHLVSDWRMVLSEVGRVTSERYATVVTERHGCQVEEIQHAYEEACAEVGHKVEHPGVRERDLARLMDPTTMVEVANCEETVRADEVIGRYRARVYSDLWGVPDDVHNRAMSRLEELYGETLDLERRERISLVIWDVETIREHVLAE